MALHVSNVPLRGPDERPRRALARRLRVAPGRLRAVVLVKRSLDARRGRKRWIGVFRVEVDDEEQVLRRAPRGVRPWTPRDDGRYGLVEQGPRRRETWPTAVRPIVVGAGPAGLFAALWMAEAGLPVRLLERGGPVEERVPAVNGFWRGRRPLDPENNLIFGEGGAGTFSDGKIYTRRRDGEIGYIFRRLVDFGADAEVLREAWAHLGTDRIRAILPVFRERLARLGVEIRFHTRVEGLQVREGRVLGVELADGTVLRGAPVLMATGHSARDSVAMMLRCGARAHARPIAVGARIEHPQAWVDRVRYRGERGELPPASYRLAHNPAEGRRAHTFCMCPGGMVVHASNHPDRVVVNGMSFAARRARWANSAVIVEVGVDDYGASDPMAGFRWQDAIERACFVHTGGYRAPAQRVVDLLQGRASQSVPSTSYPLGVVPTDLRAVLPAEVVEGMVAAIRHFDTILPGFAGEEAVLIAPETRTTSPVRFERDERRCSTTVEGLYPIGEGAGYGGGIISSALDGLRAARAICEAALNDARTG